jgi:acetyl esterase
MALDVQAKAVLDRLEELGAPSFGELSVDEHRQVMEEGAPAVFGDVPPVPFEDRTIPGPAGAISVRVYTPQAESPPVLVYFHGGGWVLGSSRTHHGVTATLAQDVGAVVISVDYRLAPEHPFPAALEDAWAAVQWAAEHAEELGARPGALAVAGDSAGGNLAAIVARKARDSGLPLALQILIYPVTDADLESASYRECAEGYFLTRDGMRWFWESYLADGDWFQPDASPLRADDLSGVAPALVLTAEFDPLRDEGEAYAHRLEEAGVPVTLTRYDGQFHGFVRMPGVIDRARDALAEMTAALDAAFAR